MIANVSEGINGTKIKKTLLGICVTTIVNIRPILSANLAANRALIPATILHIKTILVKKRKGKKGLKFNVNEDVYKLNAGY